MKINSKIKKLKQSKDGRVLVSNFAYLSLLQVTSYVFPLLTMPYLARVIGVDGFGKIAFAASIMTWFITVADWGFNYTATRDVAKKREDISAVSEIFSKVFFARMLLMLFSLVCLFLLIYIIPSFREHADVIFVSFLMIPGKIMFPDWFFQAMEKMKYITIFDFISKFLFTILVFVFIKEKDDYIFQPLFVSLGYVLSGLVAMYYILSKWHVKIIYCPINAILATIKSSTNVFINNIFPNLYSSLATVFLGAFHGPAANGIYDAGAKLSAIGDNLLNIVSRVFFPYLSRDISKHGLYAKFSLLISSLISFSLFFAAPYLIRYFFTPEFEDAILVLRIMSVLTFILTVDKVYGLNYLIVNGYDKERCRICVICSLVGGVIAFLLVYKYSYIGKSVSLLIANSFLAISSLAYVIYIKKR